MTLRLVWPNNELLREYIEALEEYKSHSKFPAHFDKEIAGVGSILDISRREKQNLVSTRTFWAVDDERYIGTVQLRLSPNARYANIKSQLYYDVRPSLRRKGLGSKIFALAIGKARAMGFSNLTIACDSKNQASKKIIERAGSQLLRSEIVPDRTDPVLMYQLSLRPRISEIKSAA